MALRFSAKKYEALGKNIDHHQLIVLGIDGCYHGDTIGAMDASGPNVYNEKVAWYKPRGYWIVPPTISLKNGVWHVNIPTDYNTSTEFKFPTLQSIFTHKRTLNSQLASIYQRYIQESIRKALQEQNHLFGVLLIEPILMGAGGMLLVDPLFQQILIQEARNFKFIENGQDSVGLPVIFDEVFTGFWRLGYESAADILGRKPDIATYAKQLTGGLVPLAVTLTNEAMFETFLSPSKTDALLHGHSYTAHPIGCQVALTALEEYNKMKYENSTWNISKLHKWAKFEGGDVASSSDQDKFDIVWSVWNPEIVHQISNLHSVKGVVALGSVLAITIRDSSGGGYASNASKKIVRALYDSVTHDLTHDFGIFARPLGNVVYLMSSQITSLKSLDVIEKKLLEYLKFIE